jgi:hypothetical protein
MTKVGKHQLENDFFTLPDRPENEVVFQKFSSEVEKFESIHIATLAMDFPGGTTRKGRQEIENEWIKNLPLLDNVKHLGIRHRVDQAFFNAICEMKNLESIYFWTSTAEDLTPRCELANEEGNAK